MIWIMFITNKRPNKKISNEWGVTMRNFDTCQMSCFNYLNNLSHIINNFKYKSSTEIATVNNVQYVPNGTLYTDEQYSIQSVVGTEFHTFINSKIYTCVPMLNPIYSVENNLFTEEEVLPHNVLKTIKHDSTFLYFHPKYIQPLLNEYWFKVEQRVWENLDNRHFVHYSFDFRYPAIQSLIKKYLDYRAANANILHGVKTGTFEEVSEEYYRDNELLDDSYKMLWYSSPVKCLMGDLPLMHCLEYILDEATYSFVDPLNSDSEVSESDWSDMSDSDWSDMSESVESEDGSFICM